MSVWHRQSKTSEVMEATDEVHMSEVRQRA